jgi:glycosyltransferase involved in cell wall biosynthesis
VPLKILFVSPYYLPAWRYGGPPQCIADLASHLATNYAAQVNVITLNANGPEPLYTSQQPLTLQMNKVTVHYLPRSKNFIGSAYFYSPFIDRFLNTFKQIDLIHVHTLFNAFSRKGMQFAVRNGIPFILTPHGMLSRYSLKKSALLKKIHRWFFDDTLMRKASAIHFTSPGEAAWARIKSSPEKVIIPIGFELDRNSCFQERPLREKLQMMFLGRLQPIKGLEPLLQALAGLDATLKNKIHLNIYGGDENNYLQKLEKLTEQLGLRSFLTFCGVLKPEEKEAVFAAHDLLVLTSYHENFGMAAAEAMAAGLPVLVSDQVGLAPFVIQHRCGWVTPPMTSSLQKTLKEIIDTSSDQRNQMGKRAFEAVRTHFHLNTVGQQFMQLYQHVLNHRL